LIFHQDQQSKRPIPIKLVTKPQISTTNRLNAFGSRSFVKLDPAKQVAKIGHCDCRLLIGERCLHQGVDTNDRIAD